MLTLEVLRVCNQNGRMLLNPRRTSAVESIPTILRRAVQLAVLEEVAEVVTIVANILLFQQTP